MNWARIGAVVVTYHTGARLKECLYALCADPDISEIVIVDNGNPPQMLDWLEAFQSRYTQVQLLTGQGNIGFGAGVNQGVATLMSELVLVINPDAVLRRNSLPIMVEASRGLLAPWIVGGKIFDLRGREERGARRRELTLFRAVTSFLGWNTWTLERDPSPTEAVSMPVISGAFFLTSKASLETLGGFDEDYFLHAEDVDLCRRCREIGGQVVYEPRAAALHYGSTSDAPSRTVAMHKADSLDRYFRKFSSGPLESVMITVLMPLMRAALWLRSR